MFKKAEFDILGISGGKSYRCPVEGWKFEAAGMEFVVHRVENGQWHVSDPRTGYGLHAYGLTRGEAARNFESWYLDAFLRTIKTARYEKLVREFEKLPRYVASPRPAFA